MAAEIENRLFQAKWKDFPHSWQVIEMRRLLSDDRGISVGVMYPGEHTPDGVPLIKAGDLNGNRINPNINFRISLEKHYEYRRTELEGGEILLSLVGDIGRCAVVPQTMIGWNAARAVAVIRLKDASDASFIRLCLLSPQLQYLMQTWATTTVQATLNLKEIRQLPIPWPPAVERKRIARILGALDDKIELNRCMNATLEATARALFQSWFVDFDPVRAKAEGRQPEGMDAETAALFPDSFEDSALGEIPRGWRVGTLSNLCRVSRGASPRPINDYMNGTVPWVKIADATAASGPFVFETKEKVKVEGVEKSVFLRKGTLILSNSATTGLPVFLEVDGCIHDGWLYFQNLRLISQYYLYFTLLQISNHLKNIADGSVQPNLNTSLVAGQKILIPDVLVLAKFNELIKSIFDRIKLNGYESRTLAETRDALLPKLMRGEVRVFDEGTNEEVLA